MERINCQDLCWDGDDFGFAFGGSGFGSADGRGDGSGEGSGWGSADGQGWGSDDGGGDGVGYDETV